MTTMLRRWVLHPWRNRRWLKNPGDMWRIATLEWKHRAYAKREGHPYYGPSIPPDYWPLPLPEGFGVVYRCFGCGELGYHGNHAEGGCKECGKGGGVIVAHYGKEEN